MNGQLLQTGDVASLRFGFAFLVVDECYGNVTTGTFGIWRTILKSLYEEKSYVPCGRDRASRIGMERLLQNRTGSPGSNLPRSRDAIST